MKATPLPIPMWLRRFVEESNRIEGITRPATSSEFNAHAAFLSLSHVSVDDLSLFVRICAPGHCLRDIAGFNVRVGNYVAPAGGPEIATALRGLLERFHDRTPRQNHVAYETLHPFTDGNGRSGRVLWLWQHLNSPDGMPGRAKGLGFLHTYYYETLAESRFEPPPLQPRVQPWLLECFGAMIAGDREERNHRFLEEALETVQSLGCTADEAHQEVGGVMITLAALCLANGLDMHSAGEDELARITVPEMVAKIRAKQAAKPKHSPLPQAMAALVGQWSCVCGWANSDVRHRCRHCGKDRPTVAG